ncbi:hypothetical protein E1293_07485 [Actinomadura darangshiensis]|uniref:Ketosynthase family 3 (KS3) domain-containing protein n=1 Tax=Actinomadura darangshiensis TaxID=705336 RepID=A0A4R5BLF5_9ACTN|nr:beta-ketoacyl synthase N-terminal-like domain-containing protein [Actinomadura darangshiensis]TDD87648.1 hypothetical protein E1293_07485 [Actinomadura darangshiensis]
MTDIAIAGIDCRFPKAADPAGLWDLLMRGAEGVTEVPKTRWNADVYYDPEGGRGKTNTRYAGFIDDADAFDHEFFGFSEAEAEVADPQVRLLLQTAWRALEDATLDPRSLAGSKTGVYVGIMGSEWMSLLMTDFQGITGHVGSGNGYAITANRISYELDLHGPSMAIDTACSSSLVAAEAACAALRSGLCDQALLGSVNLFITPASNIYFAQAKVSSPDGRCKPFSSKADGFGRAEGVAMLVLRRLEDAVADGLPIYAVIKGGAVNHGGRSTTVTAPNPKAQQEVIAEAYRNAGVRPEDVTFVETHGTGTLLGDRLEARALGKVHGVPRDEPCAIGSIKGNIGHAEGAAGIAGLIKTALALHHRVVPMSRFSDSENPRLKLAANGLKLVKEPMPLPDGDVLASVSGFGLGGTNAHLVLATAPESARPRHRTGKADRGVLTVSARSVEGLRGAVRRLSQDLAAFPDADRFAELCWTTNKVKSSEPVRFALPVRDLGQAIAKLDDAAGNDAVLSELSGEAAKTAVGWVFEAKALQGLSRELHERFPSYRRALAAVDEAFAPYGGPVSDRLLAGEGGDPVTFASAYAIGRTMLDMGLKPAWMVGEGVTEHATAVLADALDLSDACALAAGRAPAEPDRRSPRIPLYGDASQAAEEAAPSFVIGIGIGEADGPAPRWLPLRANADELLDIVATLYRAGHDPQWDELYAPDQRVRHRLTPYAFTATGRFWWTRPFDRD